jgi:arginase family enzyme
MPEDDDMTKKRSRKKVIFFGCPLDSDERDEAIQEKRSVMEAGREGDDPYSSIMELIRTEVDHHLWEEKGSIEVPGWLLPLPPSTHKEQIHVDRFVSFIDEDGCRRYAALAGKFITDHVFPDIPCMLTVDHSLSGGAFQRLVELYSPEEMSLIVLDSHTDAVPVSILSGAIRYDIETNRNSVHDPNDPFLLNRAESYNSCSFLYHLLEEGVVQPKNLYVIGISDYPPKRSFRIKDQRIKRYVGLYTGLKKKGVKIVTKKDLLMNPSKVRAILGGIETPFTYISIDMDIGARNALEGVRFRNWQGLNERQLYGIADYLMEVVSQGTQLAGMDLAEINPRRAHPNSPPGTDRTYRIATNLIKRLCFGITEVG